MAKLDVIETAMPADQPKGRRQRAAQPRPSRRRAMIVGEPAVRLRVVKIVPIGTLKSRRARARGESKIFSKAGGPNEH